MIGTGAMMATTARALVEARTQVRALAAFPGPLPETLDDAYGVQLAAIAMWPDRIAGWKVGRMSPDLADRFGTDRFIGPVFRAAVSQASPDGPASFEVFAGGSAAFEAEFVVFVGAGASGEPGPERMATGIEVAASPIAPLPALGSLASIAEFGNNAGLILGEDVALDLLTQPAKLACETRIGDAEPIRRTGESLPGGPATAFAFALAEAKRIGLPLRTGQFISTGAVTGMHAVRPGQSCSADFGAFGRIDCGVVPRAPLAPDENP